MKKTIKFLSIILLIILLMTLFTGCNKTKSPVGYWQNYEKYTYDAEYKDDNNNIIQTGVMTMEITRLTNQNISVGSYTVDSFIGTEIKFKLSMNNGEGIAPDTIDVKSYFLSNSFSPVLSSKIYNTKDKKTTIYSKYITNEYIYNVDGVEKTLSTKKKIPLCDNEIIYTVLRAYDITSSSFTQTFYIPSPMQDTIQSLTAAAYSSSISLLNRQSNAETECVGIKISLNSKISGSQTLNAFYTKIDLEYTKPDTQEKVNLSKVPIQINEGNVTYYLKSIDEIKNR